MASEAETSTTKDDEIIDIEEDDEESAHNDRAREEPNGVRERFESCGNGELFGDFKSLKDEETLVQGPSRSRTNELKNYKHHRSQLSSARDVEDVEKYTKVFDKDDREDREIVRVGKSNVDWKKPLDEEKFRRNVNEEIANEEIKDGNLESPELTGSPPLRPPELFNNEHLSRKRYLYEINTNGYREFFDRHKKGRYDHRPKESDEQFDLRQAHTNSRNFENISPKGIATSVGHENFKRTQVISNPFEERSILNCRDKTFVTGGRSYDEKVVQSNAEDEKEIERLSTSVVLNTGDHRHDRNPRTKISPQCNHVSNESIHFCRNRYEKNIPNINETKHSYLGGSNPVKNVDEIQEAKTTHELTIQSTIDNCPRDDFNKGWKATSDILHPIDETDSQSINHDRYENAETLANSQIQSMNKNNQIITNNYCIDELLKQKAYGNFYTDDDLYLKKLFFFYYPPCALLLNNNVCTCQLFANN